MKSNVLYQILFFAIIVLIILGAGSIPFYYESPSMYYKFGADKNLLRFGKIFGLIALVLLVLQPVFIAKISIVEKIFGLKKLFFFHKINAFVLIAAALLHPILVLASNQFAFFSFEVRYWPEFLGVFLLILLVIMVVVSFWQKTIGVSQKTWLMLHRVMAPIIMGLLFVHVLNVSKTFEADLPFYAVSLAAAISVFLFVKKYISRIRK